MNEARPSRPLPEMEGLSRIDEACVALAQKHGALLYDFPALISRKTLETAGYPEAFPHLLLSACACADFSGSPAKLLQPTNLKEPEWCLSPTVCHHVYPLWQNRTLNELEAMSARGRCFRSEDHFIPGERQLEFDMREIVFAGSRNQIEEHLQNLQQEILELAQAFEITARWEPALDPFFLPTARTQAMAQQITGAKLEFVVSSPSPLAIASINRHRDHFSRRFGLKSHDGSTPETACVAFGLDRWALVTRDMKESSP